MSMGAQEELDRLREVQRRTTFAVGFKTLSDDPPLTRGFSLIC